jgi:sugar lactone lactonase YvrE/DNA-binding IclR family transcriptional regulator
VKPSGQADDSRVAGAAALDKAFSLVDHIAAASAPPSAGDLGTATGLPRSTLFRLLAALEARGYVRREPGERGWRLGFRLFELAQAAWTAFDLHDAGLDEIARLSESTGETMQLVTLDGSDCVIVGAADGTQAIRRAASLGERTGWVEAAGGLALAAFADANVRKALLGAVPAERRAPLQAAIELARGRGYAVGARTDDVADLAAPILDVRGHAAAALALAGPAYRLDDRRLHALAPVLMAAARRVSHDASGTAWSLAAAPRRGAASRRVRVVDAGAALLGEAPYWSPREQALWWVDMLRPSLHRCTATMPSRRTPAHPGADAANAAFPLPRLASAAVPRRRGGVVLAMPSGLFRFDPADGATSLLAHPEHGQADHRYNDAKCDPQGRLVVGSLDTAGRPGRGNLWRIDANGAAARLDAGFTVANGLAWSPDGATLYFADSGHRVIYAYDYGERLGPRRVFARFDADVKPDGLATDADGGLWVAVWDGWRIERYAAGGRRTRTIRMPVPRPTSVAFGGPDLATLYVTSARARLDPESLDGAPASGALFAVDASTAGTPVDLFAG